MVRFQVANFGGWWIMDRKHIYPRSNYFGFLYLFFNCSRELGGNNFVLVFRLYSVILGLVDQNLDQKRNFWQSRQPYFDHFQILKKKPTVTTDNIHSKQRIKLSERSNVSLFF